MFIYDAEIFYNIHNGNVLYVEGPAKCTIPMTNRKTAANLIGLEGLIETEIDSIKITEDEYNNIYTNGAMVVKVLDGEIVLSDLYFSLSYNDQ